MPNFRRNHSKKSSSNARVSQKGSPKLIKLFLMVAILFGLLAWGVKYFPQIVDSKTPDNQNYKAKYQDPATQIRHFLPSIRLGEEVHHTFYSLSYSERHEQAEWVAYELTRDQLNHSKVKRTDWFEEDKSIRSGSAHFEDYRSSGYTKGHLAPAADMAYSKTAMDESFLMSNMSPQTKAFNGGVWRELEENVRDWAREYGHVFVVVGPVLSDLKGQKIGRNKVSVPGSYYKIILVADPQDVQSVAFHIPNELSEKPLVDYMTTIDDIENITGLDFFTGVYKNEKEERKVESDFNRRFWTFDERRFDRRIKIWNRR